MYVSSLLQAGGPRCRHPPGVAHAPAQPARAAPGAARSPGELLREHAPQADIRLVPTGGFDLWVRLQDGTDVDRLADECERDGLVIAPGANGSPQNRPAPSSGSTTPDPTQPQIRKVRASSAGPSHGQAESRTSLRAVGGRCLERSLPGRHLTHSADRAARGMTRLPAPAAPCAPGVHGPDTPSAATQSTAPRGAISTAATPLP